jgi:hypothetical protein
MSTSWKSLEDYVRGVAELRWSAICRPEHIDGVDFDGVVRVSADELVLIEITKERTLQKVRDDINKLLPTKVKLATQGLICRAFVVLEEEPTNSMVEAGKASHIGVMSAEAFERSFFDFESYNTLRVKLPFGSAVDSKTGENDPRNFIPVNYVEAVKHTRFTVDDIVTRLVRGAKIGLLGDYGAGKSRCVREVYSALCGKIREAGAFPIAVNLRDHWSSSNALEIIAGHLGNIGLSSSIDNVVRLLNSGHLILLLDGFDEIGAQSHDTRVDDRRALRRHAVRGIRDLITKSKAGILVTGRSHFFDSDEEMLQSLGLHGGRFDTLIVAAPDSFSLSEGQEYLKNLGVDIKLPAWLPRKPLVFQVLAELNVSDVTRLLSKEHGEFEFWGTFINAVCSRESRGVSNTIAPLTIKIILLDLAAKSRYSNVFLGRLSPRDIDDSYESAVGTSPDENGRQLLARMCTLGRIEPESPDRQFIDHNVIDVLRAEALVAQVLALVDSDTQKQWSQSLRLMGTIHAASLIYSFDLSQPAFSYLHKYGHTANTKKLGEIVSALVAFGNDRLDFHGLRLSHSELPYLNLTERVITNLTIQDSIVGLVTLNNCPITAKDGFRIDNSLLSLAAGVSDEAGLPDWISKTEVIEFNRLSNAARIKENPLLPQQKLLLAIVHKIFFQPGAGREEAALLKGGYGQQYSPKHVSAILRAMMRDGLIDRFKGDDGWVYTPVRRNAERMNRIRSELTLSEDPLWKEVTDLRN